MCLKKAMLSLKNPVKLQPVFHDNPRKSERIDIAHLQVVQNRFVKESCKQRLGKSQHAWQAPVKGNHGMGP